MLAPSEQTWPSVLWLVRHGESAGNVARDAAEAGGLPLIELAQRDVDVPLSAAGERQSRALGRWFRQNPKTEQPTVIFSSPYVRATQTVALLVEEARLARPVVQIIDERLREKEFGLLDRLTKAGIVARFSAEASRRAEIGKFYYRPPGGESWCDVILRLRSVLENIQLEYRRERVLIVAHQVVVLCFRYLLEKMNEEQILRIDAEKDVANCSVTDYHFIRNESGRGEMALRSYNFVAPLEDASAPVTREPDVPVAAR
ncbi:MAG TPA: histidine phosphatase family protein [Polyangiaceae bacterium]|nr:histidine phosphatase family protein [Polyangiaceae bacterium]